VQLPLSAIAEQLLLMAMTAGSAGKGTSAGRYSAGREGS
jgi:hypothetical protein